MKDLGQGEIQALYSFQVYNHYPQHGPLIML